jgi:hypothetical protein
LVKLETRKVSILPDIDGFVVADYYYRHTSDLVVEDSVAGFVVVGLGSLSDKLD